MPKFIIGDVNRLSNCVSNIRYCKRDKEVQDYVSSNSIMYWIFCRTFDCDYYVMKDTTEGELLTHMLEDEQFSSKEIINFLDTIAFKNMTIDDMKDIIENEKQKSFKEGQYDIKHKMRKLILQ